MSTERHDLVIIGGGLAGLGLSLQLRRALPDLDVAVVERNTFPAPEITHKVGESTVEIGSTWLADTLGLRDHLDEQQLRKFGLRFFFGANETGKVGGRGKAGDLDQADELGVSTVFPTPTWQVDRGRLENELLRRARAAGVTVLEGLRVKRLSVDGVKRVHCVPADFNGAGNGASGEGGATSVAGERILESRWLVDAASRASPLKRSLDLARRNTHDINANWFRVRGEIRVDDWSADPQWRGLTGDKPRWLSTNQLTGPGYWVWLIPLASGATSLGIVADPRYHDFEHLKTPRATQAWLQRFEPRLAAEVEQREVLDFAFLRHFSHDCGQVFSDQGWALTGEASVFLDPLYSPGTDFIAIANTYITDLVTREVRGEDIRGRTRALEAVYRSLYENTLSIYQGLYGGFGSPQFMVPKTTWDYSYYWSVFAPLFTWDAMTRLADDTALRNQLLTAVALNRGQQRRLRALAETTPAEAGRGRFFDQRTVPLLCRLNAQLTDGLEGPALLERITANVMRLERLSGHLAARMEDPSRPAGDDEREMIGDVFPELLSA